ncbi:MAG: nicotinate phosphoribosyltransferase [Treponema sp.]|jgi:nicotinate phosphoribosyltransferase|nr:nicotinate phosphoribosyltransferase [Treponema sp.]
MKDTQPGFQSALLADFYALTMAQGFWKKGMNSRAIFEMFFRDQPFRGGFSVFAGLGTLLERVRGFGFSADDIEYLRGLKVFEEGFLDYLRGFRFTGSLWAMDEGRVVFSQEPLVRVDAGLIECQLLEGMLLNIINFQTLIATKTARVWLASGKGSIMEFGLRRAQGPDGAMSASRAAYIGGAAGTSNVLAGKVYGIPVLGTMAHAWIMSFPSEEAAFRAYAQIYPGKTVFLIDTYDTLKSGTPNAIKVGRELAAQGKNFGVRLDSGDIQYLSTEVRKMLDAAGLPKASIAVSNDLDESIIQTLRDSGAPVDSWGVGTQMVTGGNQAAFPGVYKLMARENAEHELEPAIKFSDNPEKTTMPGIKQVWRLKDRAGMALADVMALDADCAAAATVPVNAPLLRPGESGSFWHPAADYRRFSLCLDGEAEPLLKPRMLGGELAAEQPGLEDIRRTVKADLEALDPTYKRLLNPHIYKVSITGELRELKLGLIKKHLGDLQGA